MKNSFNLGDIVSLKSQGAVCSKIKISNKHSLVNLTSPFLIITEIVNEGRDKKQFDEQIGKKIADTIKYCCTWFNYAKATFESRWFYESSIKKVKQSLFSLNFQNCEIGDVVTLKTFNLSSQESIYSEQRGKVLIRRINLPKDHHHFIPPEMTVCGFKMEKNLPIFNPKTNEKIRVYNPRRVKCMYYNHVQNKFSEEYFIPEVLMKI